MTAPKLGVLFLVVALGACLGACTKPNPGVCCTTLEDCRSVGLPTTATCAVGLACDDHACVAASCAVDTDCPAATPFCDAQICRACDETRGCTSATPRCELVDFTCQGCVGEADCASYPATPHCGPTGACVACVDSSQCGGTSPVCDGACRACRLDSECPSDVCDFDTGACVAETDVMYAAPAGSLNATTCTRQNPCELRRLFDVAVGMPRVTIRALPGTYTFDGNGTVFVDDPSEVWLHGAGAIFSGSGVDLAYLQVDGAVGGVKLHVHDLAFDGAAVVVGNSGELSLVHVDASASYLTIVSGSTTSMVDCQFANTTIQMQDVSTLTIEGSSLTGTIGTYSVGANITVRNSVIVSPLAGANQHEFMSAVGNGGNLTFESSTLFNTYVARGLLSNSILYSPGIGLASVMAPSIATANYSLVNPQAGAFNGANNLKNVDPMFVNAATGDLHLLAGSPAIDAANPTSTNTIDHDGVARPQNGRSDMGAFEHAP